MATDPREPRSLGEVLHRARQAGGEQRPRPWPVEDWAARDPRLRALDEAMAAAVAEVVRERIGAALDRVTKMAEAWAALAPPDDWGQTPADTVAADAGRAILAAIKGSSDEKESP
jgi:hypothetical protein